MGVTLTLTRCIYVPRQFSEKKKKTKTVLPKKFNSNVIYCDNNCTVYFAGNKLINISIIYLFPFVRGQILNVFSVIYSYLLLTLA